MRYNFLFFVVLSSLSGFSQIPDSIRFDWNVSGEEPIFKPEIKINVLDFGFGNDGVFDNTSKLQSLINSLQSDSQLVIYFPTGLYKFSATIYLRSGITIEGEGGTNTKFMFDNGGSGNLFEVIATQSSNFIFLKNGLTIHSRIIEADSQLTTNKYYEFLVDGDGYTTSDWAKSSIGQIFKIDSIINDSAFLSTQLKLDYYKYKNPRIRLINPIRDVHFKYISLERLDKTSGQTANFNFNYAINCTVIGVESNRTNMSHITMGKSYRCRVADSYFHHAHDYGGGGKAYGVELRYSTSNCLIENNIFDNLRHSILLQAGPNGNVIAGNFSINPFWKEGIFPANSAGELVLHGNYPFANLFESNEVGNIVVDNSHGINGPGNVFYRNKASLWGVLMNTGAGHATHFIGNEIIGTLNILTGDGNVNYVNYTSTTDPSIFKNIVVPQSLYVKNKPIWWPTKKPFPALGLPPTKNLTHIPASYRYNHDSLRALKATSNIFLANFINVFKKINDSLTIELESKLQVNVSSLILEKFYTKHKIWSPITSDFSNRHLFQTDTIKEFVLLAKETSCYRWVAKGMNFQE
ncbi:MAG: glycosyl hydrolase family 28-related protein, partial [Bacteroidia bacterium]